MSWKPPFLATSLVVASLAALLGTWVVHSVVMTSEDVEAAGEAAGK